MEEYWKSYLWILIKWNSIPACGVRSYQPPKQQTRIIGGENADRGEFPWQVKYEIEWFIG